jgi:hypothetical protein
MPVIKVEDVHVEVPYTGTTIYSKSLGNSTKAVKARLCFHNQAKFQPVTAKRAQISLVERNRLKRKYLYFS